ncbi:hypothetical protein AB6E53_11835 [Vibrio breoganii]
MIKTAIVCILVAFFLVMLPWVCRFGFELHLASTEDFYHLGGYLGGVLGPLFTSASVLIALQQLLNYFKSEREKRITAEDEKRKLRMEELQRRRDERQQEADRLRTEREILEENRQYEEKQKRKDQIMILISDSIKTVVNHYKGLKQIDIQSVLTKIDKQIVQDKSTYLADQKYFTQNCDAFYSYAHLVHQMQAVKDADPYCFKMLVKQIQAKIGNDGLRDLEIMTFSMLHPTVFYREFCFLSGVVKTKFRYLDSSSESDDS